MRQTRPNRQSDNSHAEKYPYEVVIPLLPEMYMRYCTLHEWNVLGWLEQYSIERKTPMMTLYDTTVHHQLLYVWFADPRKAVECKLRWTGTNV